jgi:acetylglutamate kinase
VVACVAGDRQGRIYNVNADQMAVACAVAYGARTLVFLTDVEGVRDAQGAVRETLTPQECERLIAEGVATGGMRAKLTAAMDALRGGVENVRIAPGAAPNALSRLMAGEALGTRIALTEAPKS